MKADEFWDVNKTFFVVYPKKIVMLTRQFLYFAPEIL